MSPATLGRSRPSDASDSGGGARLGDERGAALVELSLVALLLATMALGTYELGRAWSDSQLVTQAARSGARVASQMSDDPDADLRAVEAIEAALGPLSADDVTVLIYDAANADGSPDTSCTAATPPGRAGVCSAYDQTHFTNFIQGSWVPADRTTDLINPVYIGVRVEVRRPTLSGIFAEMPMTIADTAVMRAEPPVRE